MILKLLLAFSVAASAAPWVVSYKRTTKERETVSIEAQDDGKVRLCLEAQCSILTAHEALELARVIYTVIPADAEKSFDELAEEAVLKTDEYFCHKAKSQWEREAFCTGLRIPVSLREVPPYMGYGRRHGKAIYIHIGFESIESAERALNQMAQESGK